MARATHFLTSQTLTDIRKISSEHGVSGQGPESGFVSGFSGL